MFCPERKGSLEVSLEVPVVGRSRTNHMAFSDDCRWTIGVPVVRALISRSRGVVTLVKCEHVVPAPRGVVFRLRSGMRRCQWWLGCLCSSAGRPEGGGKA